MQLSPYRSIVVREKKVKKTFGIIKVSPPHECIVPGFWKRLFNFVSEGSLFRCAECGEVYQWGAYIFHDGTRGVSNWKKSTIEKWEEHGGDK